MSKYIIGVDSGTTSARALVLDRDMNVMGVGQQEINQIYPKPGWVEHDANEVWEVTRDAIGEAMKQAGCDANDIVAIGITNQRESVVMWDLNTGEPVYNLIVWQDRRQSDFCEEIKASGMAETYRKNTGLEIDSYYSATKVRWILDNVPGVEEKAKRGEIAFGNVDTWIIYNLTKGKSFLTDYSNAARSMMFNINNLQWDKDILQHLDIEAVRRADVLPSSADYGMTDPELFGAPIPICGDIGDQQSALFGQACFEEGMAKMTYGTAGVFGLNTGRSPLRLPGLTASCMVGLGDEVWYEVEGIHFIVGAAVQWLRDGIKVVKKSSDVEQLATSVDDNGGVYFVPAFVGLCSPHWDSYARGTIVGLTGGTTEAHLARAALEQMAYQTRDSIDRYVQESGKTIPSLRVDGGAVNNQFVMQFVADITGVPVKVPKMTEATAGGTAWAAGLWKGYWEDLDDLQSRWKVHAEYEPQMTRSQADELYEDWQRAVERSRGWVKRGQG